MAPNGASIWAACVALLIAGFTQALGTLGPAVAAVDAGLYATFVQSGGWRNLAFGAGVAAGGLACDVFPQHIVAAGVLSSVLSMGIVGNSLALLLRSAALMMVGNIVLGLSSGVIYGIGVLMVSRWIRCTASASALSMFFYMSGTMVATSVMSALVAVIGVVHLFWVIGFGLLTAGVIASRMFAFPDAAPAVAGAGAGAAKAAESSSIGADIFREPSLYAMLVVTAVAQAPALGYVNAFSGLLLDFAGIEPGAAASLFVAFTVFGLVLRLVTGYAATLRTASGPLSNGARNVAVAVLVVEAVSVLLLRLAGNSRPAFVGGLLLSWVPWHSGTVCMVLLAEELFGAANTGVVFGLANVVVGIVSLVSTYVMAAVADHAPGERAAAFGSLCSAYLVLSCAAVLIAMTMAPSARCFATSADEVVVLLHPEDLEAAGLAEPSRADRLVAGLGHLVEPFANSISTLGGEELLHANTALEPSAGDDRWSYIPIGGRGDLESPGGRRRFEADDASDAGSAESAESEGDGFTFGDDEETEHLPLLYRPTGVTYNFGNGIHFSPVIRTMLLEVNVC